MKRFLALSRLGLLSALLVFSSLVGSLLPFLSSSVSAATPYDSAVQLIENPVLIAPNGTTEHDLALDYLTLISSSSSTDCSTAYSQIGVALSGMGSTGLSIIDEVADGNGFAGYFYYSQNNSLEFGFNNSSVTGRNSLRSSSTNITTSTAGTSGGSVLYRLNNDGTVGVFCFPGSFVTSANTISADLNPQETWIWYSSSIINYPVGYAGPVVPSSPSGPIVYKYPSISYSVDNNKVIANYNGPGCINSTENPEQCVIGKLLWTVQDNDSETVYTVVTGFKDTFNFTASEYGHYDLSVIYVDAGVPYLPLPDEFTYTSTTIEMYISGSNTYSSDTSMCPVSSGFVICAEVLPYEDCSTFGVDVVGGLGCVMNNFGVFLRGMLHTIFVPNPEFFVGYFDQFTTFLNTKLGFIYNGISSVFLLLGSALAGAATTSCVISPPGTLFGAPVEFNICMLEEIIGEPAFIAIQALVIGITVVALVFAAMRKYHEVVDKR